MKESRDILTLFASINNHEVFTPPQVARDMLDLIPSEVWSNPSAKLLDPCVKSGVFLREAYFKFFDGLKGKGCHLASDGQTYNLDDNQERTNHILKNMLYGIATSELTSYISRRTLYGVMKADSDKSSAALEAHSKHVTEQVDGFIDRNTFNDYFKHEIFHTDEYKGCEWEGNIFYPTSEVQKKVIENGSYEVEDTYYPFIESETQHKKIRDIQEGKMKFDVVIGNPPYQKSDGGHGASAAPIYHHFIESALALNPRFITMITPSRWMFGGKGLDKFRAHFLKDKRIVSIQDFENSKDCFPSVDIKGGVNYFLWNKSHNGQCIFNGKPRSLDQFETFVRSDIALSILNKVTSKESRFMDEVVSARKPFGVSTSFDDYSKKKSDEKPYKLFGNKQAMKDTNGVGYVSQDQFTDRLGLIGKNKVIVPYAYGNGIPSNDLLKPFIIKSEDVCTETYLVAYASNSILECENMISYMKTKFFNFLVSVKKTTQHATKSVYEFVPFLDMNQEWTDEILYERFGLSAEEIEYIESSVKAMD